MKYAPSFITVLLLIALVSLSTLGSVAPTYAQSNTVSFTTSTLQGTPFMSTGPTSLQFGPDGRLYLSIRLGTIFAYEVKRNGANDYVVTATEKINLVKEIQNHDDDGSINNDENSRQVTGLLVTGTPQEPILYVTSSDPRIGAGAGGLDLNLDTNSGIISRLTLVDGEWSKVDLVRGLPRSEENHATNGMALDEDTNILYVTSGGFTNAGSPSTKFAFATEYALAAAILSVDLNAIDALPIQDDNGTKYIYDLPTVNDPERADDESGNDINDPFGGNDGLNQAKIVPGGPVQVYSPGYRNPYDLVFTEAGQLFTIDNGANGGWGGFSEDESANCTNDYVPGEPGSSGTTDDGRKPVNNLDNLHLVEEGFYGGHAAPVRGNPTGAGLYTHDGSNGVWRTSKSGPNPLPADWPPVPEADARQCDFINPGEGDKALETFLESTNGIAEYTTDNFGGELKGDLITASFNTNGVIWRVDLGDEPVTNDGSSNVTKEALATSVSAPLDVVAQGADQPFSGTIWFTSYIGREIQIMEPADYDGENPLVCTGIVDTESDDDKDGYSNADEVDNGNNPCSASDVPPDNDKDFISDLNDSDDDNDGQPDVSDPFAIDDTNGSELTLPVDYPFFNEIPGTGMWGVGFTGLMSNGTTDYSALYPDSINNVVGGGTAGLFTVVEVDSGDATGATNTQQFGFQFGVNVDSTMDPFETRVRVAGPFFDSSPTGNQTQGMFIGTGDQDNYLKVAVHANDGNVGIQVLYESNGEIQSQTIYPRDLSGVDVLDLFITVDPATGSAQPKISINGQPGLLLGDPIALDGAVLNTIQSSDQAMAVGIIASAGDGPSFTATWDEAEIAHETFMINSVPVLAPLPEQNVVEDEVLSVQITATDPDSGLFDQSLSLSLSNNPVGMSVTENGDGSWTLSWQPTGADIGTHEIQATATDSLGESASATLKINVVAKNQPPQIQFDGTTVDEQLLTVTLAENESRTAQIAATDPNGDDVSLAATGLPAYASYSNNSDGTATLVFSPDFTDAGETTITVTATDIHDASAVIQVSLVISDVNHPPTVDDPNLGDPSPTVMVEIGETLTLPVSFVDADKDSLSLAFKLAEVPMGLSLTDNGDGTGVITWDTAAFLDDDEPYSLIVVATDAKGASAERNITVEFAMRKIYMPYYR